jgi:hypothetical protein
MAARARISAALRAESASVATHAGNVARLRHLLLLLLLLLLLPLLLLLRLLLLLLLLEIPLSKQETRLLPRNAVPCCCCCRGCASAPALLLDRSSDCGSGAPAKKAPRTDVSAASVDTNK